jgi:ankyrin repeat protein
MLCKVVFEGNMEQLRLLLKAGANTDAIDYDKQTALHIAAADGNLPAVSGVGLQVSSPLFIALTGQGHRGPKTWCANGVLVLLPCEWSQHLTSHLMVTCHM